MNTYTEARTHTRALVRIHTNHPTQAHAHTHTNAFAHTWQALGGIRPYWREVDLTKAMQDWQVLQNGSSLKSLRLSVWNAATNALADAQVRVTCTSRARV